jgi:hypothetical protein
VLSQQKLKTRRSWNYVLQALKENNCQSRLVYLAKLFLQNLGINNYTQISLMNTDGKKNFNKTLANQTQQHSFKKSDHKIKLRDPRMVQPTQINKYNMAPK